MRDYEYPIFCLDNRCVHCGAKNTLFEVNIFGSHNTNKRYPVTKMKCSKCKREYFIRWDTNEFGDYNVPVSISYNYIDYFANMFAKDIECEEVPM